jgi:hypothetical protein
MHKKMMPSPGCYSIEKCEGWAFRLLVRIYVLIPTSFHNE